MSESDANLQADVQAIDQQIRALLDARARLLQQHRDNGTDVHQPERVVAYLNELCQPSADGFSASQLDCIFREVLSAGRALANPLKVAYLGPEGTFTQAATFAHFGHSVSSVPVDAIPDVFEAVETGRVAHGVVPVENSTEGAVNVTLDRLMDSTLHIVGEVRLGIRHNLLSTAANMTDIQSVHAHPQALAQCRQWLDTHLPGVPTQSESSNAAAAQLAQKTPGVAAIAGLEAGQRYALNVLAERIEDNKNNTTRFLVLGKHPVAATGHDTTSLLVSAPHKPGGLRRMLLPFEEAGVSLTRIESRPGRTALWDYVFFIDVSGHHSDDTLIPVLNTLREELPLVRVLGSYPAYQAHNHD